ncbi:nucleotide-diphospho-sugar transferase [Pluteus cervinus]|uniref:Nucleotide-diphospho-sugar transferase n=1 Tax=Pluteus cervinus TaxID=181527 RepID=A0ACD3BDL4_9AGAR|nr:nucleotide-diphospho-sugar transferase [Pluteus cervinus]
MRVPGIWSARQTKYGDYTQLPVDASHINEKVGQDHHRKKWNISPVTLYLTALLVAGVVGGIVYRLREEPYNPLDNYQYACHFHRSHAPLFHSGFVQESSVDPYQSRAVISTLYSDSYALAVAVLGHSIQRAKVKARPVLLYLEGRVSPQALCIVAAAGWQPIPVPFIAPPHNGTGIHQRFGDQYTKLNIWGLEEIGIERAVYLDADTLVRRNFDELFEIGQFDFAAVPDVYENGFVVAFNAGVMVIRTSTKMLDDMKSKLEDTKFPLHEAEQAFLNVYYGASALRLPYAYNANLAIKVRSRELWKSLEDEMRIVHYTLVKPFVVDFSPKWNYIMTADEMRGVVAQAENKKGGLFREEIRWWGSAFEEAVFDLGDKLAVCYHQ